MFTRIKKSGKNQYLQIGENRRENNQTKQGVICTLGRMDRLHKKGEITRLIHSFAKYSQQALLILTGKKEVSARAKKIGPSLIIEENGTALGVRSQCLGLCSKVFQAIGVAIPPAIREVTLS